MKKNIAVFVVVLISNIVSFLLGRLFERAKIARELKKMQEQISLSL